MIQSLNGGYCRYLKAAQTFIVKVHEVEGRAHHWDSTLEEKKLLLQTRQAEKETAEKVGSCWINNILIIKYIYSELTNLGTACHGVEFSTCSGRGGRQEEPQGAAKDPKERKESHENRF